MTYSHTNRFLGRMAIGPDGAERNVFLVPMVYIAGDGFVLAAFFVVARPALQVVVMLTDNINIQEIPD